MLPFQPNCWSEHEELEIVMLAPPSKLDVPDAETAKQLEWTASVSRLKAQQNYLELKGTLEHAGVKVIDYPEALPEVERELSEKLINRYYVRDLACVFGNTLIPGEPKISMRKPEFAQAHMLMKKWFPDLFLDHDLKAMEYGDVLILNKDAIFINVGLRTSMESVEKIKGSLLFDAGFSEIGIIDLPRHQDSLHLDLCCNVAGKDLLVSKSFVKYLPVHTVTRQASRYEMPESFFMRHGFSVYWLEKCNTIPDINFLNLDPDTLLISGRANQDLLKNHPKMKKKKFIEVDVAELEKGGGGVRCMTLPLRRKS